MPRSPRRRPRLLYVVNADWFFLSHRLPLGLAAMEAGFEVSVCAGSTGSGPAIEATGMRFLPLFIRRGGTRPASELATVAALGSTYASVRPDIVHHVTIKPVIYGSVVARALGVRAIVNSVSGLGYAFIPRSEDDLRHRLLQRSLWAAYRVALDGPRTKVVFQNEDDRATFVERKLVAPERTVLVRGSGVDLSTFAPSPLPAGDLVVLVPARLLRDKGVGEFVEAAKRLKGRFPTARFVLLGRLDPDNPAAIPAETVEGWVREGIVEWRKYVNHDEMPAAFAGAHVVVLPSYREGLPLALAEAQACGRACVTTDVPGCRDAIEPGTSGWLVPPRDAAALEETLAAALSDREELAKRGAAGVRVARERFAIGAVVSHTLSLYRELLGEEWTAL